MTLVVDPPELIPFPQSLALRDISVVLTRGGEQTSQAKLVRVMDENLVLVALFFTAHSSTGRFLAEAVDKTWIFLATDDTAPARAAALRPTIVGDVVLEMDLAEPGGGGGGGAPATLDVQVRVEGAPGRREVVAVERRADGGWRVAGSGETGESGTAVLDLRVGASGAVYALCPDAWGRVFQPSLSVTAGQRIRPSAFSGVLYEITEPGVLPATEPEWWPITTEGSRELGTARAAAVRYYRPLALGPVPVELT